MPNLVFISDARLCFSLFRLSKNKCGKIYSIEKIFFSGRADGT
jgi:hypothetical protein